MLSFCNASRWHEDVLRSSSSVLLEWDEETCGRLCSMMSHMSAGKGWASEASRVTPASGSSRVEVGTYHDGFCGTLIEVNYACVSVECLCVFITQLHDSHSYSLILR